MWQQPVKQALEMHLQDASAADLCMRYFSVVKSYDDVAQGKSLLPSISSAAKDMWLGFPKNQFFNENKHTLWGIAIHGFVCYADALSSASAINKPIAQMSDSEKTQAANFVFARGVYKELAISCAAILGKDSSALRSALNAIEVL